MTNKALLCILAITTLTSCSNLEKLKRTPITGRDFNSELARDYLSMADLQARLYDWASSEHFARKGLDATAGKYVMPDNVEKIRIGSPAKEELMQVRSQLVDPYGVLNDSNKYNYPKATADAQAYYDCWMEEQNEGWEKGPIEFCKRGVTDIIAGFNRQITPEPQVPPEPEAPAPQEQAFSSNVPEDFRLVAGQERDNKIFQIYFAFDKSSVQHYSENKQVIKQSIDMIKSLGDQVKVIHLSGFADDTGSEAYNYRLGVRRAIALKDELVKHGIDANKIYITSYGKHFLAIPTAKGKPCKLNRRAQIDIM
jgi:OOP family OmpA-OmpF porin